MVEDILMPIAGMLFVLTLIFGWPILGMIKRSRQSINTSELQHIGDRLAQLDELEERIRVLESVITDGNYQLRKQFEDLEKE